MLEYSNRTKWNKNHMIEDVDYIKIFMRFIAKKLSKEERQNLYMIAKFYTDGVEHARNNLELSKYYFDLGDFYMQKISRKRKLLIKLIYNSHDRAKSYYYYKNNELNKSIETIEHILDINYSLEKEGFGFLIFDRLSQYKNYSKTLFMNNRINESMSIVYDLICFLITSEARQLKKLNISAKELFKPEYENMRNSLLNQLIFDTFYQLSDASKYYNNILEITKEFSNKLFELESKFHSLNDNDRILRKWIILLKGKKQLGNEQEISLFIKDYSTFYEGIPADLLVSDKDVLNF